MTNDHHYKLQLRWSGDPAVGTASYATYDRAFRIDIAGKPSLAGSADPMFRGERTLHNPEDLFVAAIASCHMLSYLALCARGGVSVISYVDDARGRLRLHGGGGRFEHVSLYPRVQIAAGCDVSLAIELHDRAHEQCFIASSCNAKITCEPIVTVAIGEVLPPSSRRQDVAVRLQDRPGALAQLGEVLGQAGVSLEGGGGFTIGDACVVHYLVDDGDRAASALRDAGMDVLGVRDVIEVRLAQDEPGQLGKLARAMAGAGINIECIYSDHDHQLIVCVDDLAAAQRVAAQWRAASHSRVS
jgi:organic hydroperoxide reductase OsmC/OhrA